MCSQGGTGLSDQWQEKKGKVLKEISHLLFYSNVQNYFFKIVALKNARDSNAAFPEYQSSKYN